MTHVLGVDPGLSGGVAILGAKGSLLDAQPFPTKTVNRKTRIDGVALAAMIDLMCPRGRTLAFVENVSSRPRQAGQFQFGVNTGLVHGILYALGVSFELVAPAVWKSIYGIKRSEDETKSDMKTEARRVASAVFPLQAEKFKRVRDDGVAEAALIALYGLKKTRMEFQS